MKEQAAPEERSMIFPPQSVRSILDGTKTQTRQIVNPQPSYFVDAPHWRWKGIACASGDCTSIFGAYVPGERLWVKEKFQGKPPSNALAAGRIILEITGVRIQQVQDISEEDAIAEGAMEWWNSLTHGQQEEVYSGGRGPCEAFRGLWDSINEKKWPWSANCFVWAITFKRIEP